MDSGQFILRAPMAHMAAWGMAALYIMIIGLWQLGR